MKKKKDKQPPLPKYGHILPVTEDPDLFYQVQRDMRLFPFLFSDAERRAYDVKFTSDQSPPSRFDT